MLNQQNDHWVPDRRADTLWRISLNLCLSLFVQQRPGLNLASMGELKHFLNSFFKLGADRVPFQTLPFC